ncbi:MAG: riboflavin synthase [Chthoniobacterales bacterium]|nr:riboflavin synthase [Chthoniobacterales bacterium]
MFTGLVEETSRLAFYEPQEFGARLTLEPPSFAEELHIGDSLALNGCCLTVARLEAGHAPGFDLLQETLVRTNLGRLQIGSPVNLERPLRAGSQLGGHFVQGHIDSTTSVLESTFRGDDLYLRFGIPPGAEKFFIEKGSIAVNGVSLTVATLGKTDFGVWIIPHTRAVTNLGLLQIGDIVNLEYDMLAKYILRFLELQTQKS